MHTGNWLEVTLLKQKKKRALDLMNTQASLTPQGPLRFWIYQRERFPLMAHAPLIACFSFCAISYSAQLRGGNPGWFPVLVAFISCLISFLHLRIADEFKDFEDDRTFRPYRPVPRGLVTLRELGWIWIGTGLIQLTLALILDRWLVAILLTTWLYLALMTREFFVRDWLKAHPVFYMTSHMVIMPLVDFYATSCDWMPAGQGVPSGLFWFLVVSYFNGITLEVGRKIRAPQDEEHGVETYSALWGRSTAVGVWWFAMAATAMAGIMAARAIHFVETAAVIYACVLLIAFIAGSKFLRSPETRRARGLETLSGLWTMTLYLVLGALPLVLKILAK